MLTISAMQWPPNSSQPCGLCNLGKAAKPRLLHTNPSTERLVEEWSRFDHEITSAAVTQWRACPHACVKADGGHFERFL